MGALLACRAATTPAVVPPAEPARPDPAAAERLNYAERAVLLLDADPSYVDPAYGVHSRDCWLGAFPDGECRCAGVTQDATITGPLDALLRITGDAA